MQTNSKLIHRINKKLINHFGIPGISKDDPDPLDMIIATILSQNTNDKNSYKAYKDLKQKYPEWELVAKLPVAKLETVIRVAGLAKQKSAAIKNLLVGLAKKQSKISLDYLYKMNDKEVLAELTSFRGVGTKTSACVLLFSMKRDICPVDTHVHRTLNRIGLVTASTPDKTFSSLHNNFPKNIAHSFHTNLIRLGREICKPSRPHCSLCPVEKLCFFGNKNYDVKVSSMKNDFMLLDNVSNV